jgi:hypothetical protein
LVPPEPSLLEFVLVAVIGATVGASELVARYRDAPTNALVSLSACLYMAINAAAAIAALFLIDALGWTFGYEAADSGFEAVRILVAGFAAMALFRSSLFLLPVGDDTIGIGPSTMLQSFLDAADRGVDRTRARRRAKAVRKSVAPISYSDASEALPALCLGLVQNPSDADQVKLSEAAQALTRSNFSDEVKLYLLGLAIMNFGGSSVLDGGIALLRKQR